MLAIISKKTGTKLNYEGKVLVTGTAIGEKITC
jgi:hypothetical protein